MLEQRGTWRSLDTGAVTGEKTLASAFVVRDREQVARYARYESLEDALDAADLDPTDEIA